MSFENIDAERLPLCDDYDTVAHGTMHPLGRTVDAYESTGIIPLEETDFSQVADQPAETQTSAMPYESYHWVKGRLTPGEHPITQVSEALHEIREHKEAVTQAKISYLTKPHRHMQEYDSLRTNIREQLIADFGPRMANLAITVISREDADAEEYAGARAGENDLGVYSHGHAAIHYPQPYIASEAERIMPITGLHEGAHGSMTGEKRILVARRLTEKDKKPTRREQELGRKLTVVTTGGFREYDPSLALDDSVGEFWEEAFSESYARRRRDNLGLPAICGAPSKRTTFQSAGTQASIKFTDDGNETLYNAADETICIPWKYAKGTLEPAEPGDPRLPLMSPNTYAAYALDILDGVSPGLFDDMMVSRNEPAALQEVKYRMHTIAPTLYRGNSLLGLTMAHMEHGLLSVIRQLGIADTPIKSILK